MPLQVVNGAMMTCSQGTTPSSLIVLPTDLITSSSQPAATIVDNKPIMNVAPFGMCMSLANPAVASATAAAMGVLTPMPCIPNTPAPWMPGDPTVLHGHKPTLTDDSKLTCLWAGVIQVTMAGQTQHILPRSGGGGAAAALATPATPSAAPATVDLSNMQKGFDLAWSDSFPGGASQEQGGTIVFDETGQLSMTNVGSGKSGSFSPNLKVPSNQNVAGVFHTHPYDATEGGHTGVSLSGGDAGYLINKNHNLMIAQSGDEQFMYVRTAQTPARVDAKALNDAQNARISELTKQGMSFSDASKKAARETANANGLAYYEGKKGVFQRVEP